LIGAKYARPADQNVMFMEETQNIDELKKEFSEKKKEVYALKSQVNSIGISKEDNYRELRSIRDKIKFRASKIQELKKARDDLTKQVKEFKEERNKLNTEVKEKAEERKEVSSKKKEILDKMNIPEDPVRIKLMIERIQTSIETEVMPFSQEQKLNKKIKELKAQLKELEKLGDVWKEINSASTNLSEARKKAEDTHKNVQTLAKQSQDKHEEINRLYEELKALRTQEQPIADKYVQDKTRFEQLLKELTKKQVRVTELGKILHEEDEKDYSTRVKDKTNEVKEKLRKRQKLSTEDILAFQALKD
jgi:uncharacterized coiled-coil DUF342 family protein